MRNWLQLQVIKYKMVKHKSYFSRKKGSKIIIICEVQVHTWRKKYFQKMLCNWLSLGPGRIHILIGYRKIFDKFCGFWSGSGSLYHQSRSMQGTYILGMAKKAGYWISSPWPDTEYLATYHFFFLIDKFFSLIFNGKKF